MLYNHVLGRTIRNKIKHYFFKWSVSKRQNIGFQTKNKISEQPFFVKKIAVSLKTTKIKLHNNALKLKLMNVNQPKHS